MSFISKYNPKLSEKIMKIESLTNDISFVNTVLNEPNLQYNGIFLHSKYGAESEAKEIFEKVQNTEFSMNVIFGFGLGYLFQEFAINSKGLVFVFEPDIEILATTLEVVDFSEELSRKNVFIFNDFDELQKRYLESYIYNSETTITFLPSYKHLFSNELNIFAKELNLTMGSAIMDNNYIKYKLVPAVKTVCTNLEYLLNEPPLGTFENIYQGKTALLISAGPSLDKNIEVIKKYRDNVIIFSVGQALRTLMTNDITPDFVGLVETGNQMSQLDGLDTSNINLILEPLTYTGLHNSKFKNIWVQPAADDAGGSLGAAYLVWYKILGNKRNDYSDQMKGCFLGPKIDKDSKLIDDMLKSYGGVFRKLNDDELSKEVAKIISDEKVIGIARGRMEFGPRALGNRSILADARKIEMQEKLNLKIKFRESFRPFAPIVLEDDCHEYFEMNDCSPYMLCAYKIREDKRIKQNTNLKGMELFKQKRSDIPAVTHIDYSARVQTVNEKNDFIYKVLKYYKDITGLSVLINTSFNVRGEPIVDDEINAFKCFMLTDMDYVVIGNRLFDKKKQNDKIFEKYKKEFGKRVLD